MFRRKKGAYETPYGNYLFAETLEQYVLDHPAFSFPETAKGEEVPKKKNRVWLAIPILLTVGGLVFTVLKILHKV